jgi:hypothetical protein
MNNEPAGDNQQTQQNQNQNQNYNKLLNLLLQQLYYFNMPVFASE